MELTGFDEAVGTADLVLTGEGKVDGQTAFGKTAMGVAERARAAGCQDICFGGGVTAEGAEFMHSIGVVTMPVTERPMTLDEVPGGRDSTHRPCRRTRGGAGGPRRRARLMASAGSRQRKPAKRRKADPIKPWAKRLKVSPGPASSSTCSRACSRSYGVPAWKRVLDPTSELVLAILSAELG